MWNHRMTKKIHSCILRSISKCTYKLWYILTFTYDYVYNFNLYFARASEGIHLHVLCISFSFKILVKKKIWWKTSLDILKKIEKINCNRIISWSAHTSEVHHHRKKSVCTSTNAVWKKENKVNLELQSPLFIVLFDYLNQLMKVKLTIKVKGRSECLPIKPVFVKKSVTEYGKVINSYILIYSLQNWWNFGFFLINTASLLILKGIIDSVFEDILHPIW